MFTKFASITAAVALGIAGVAISANTANGGAVEYFKCSLAEGKTMEDLVSVASHFHGFAFSQRTLEIFKTTNQEGICLPNSHQSRLRLP